jgi:predicted unusual protein kinase regulating ubiquinone biosynthesis (AarF/ABC1/UbiB family)
MKIEEKQIEKADPLLQEALKRANGDEILRAIMLLGPESDSEQNHTEEEPDPEQFPNRAAYRQALINNQQSQISRQLSDIIQDLQARSLTLFGGTISPTVVVEGAAREILRSLDLPGVRHASLDRVIQLHEPSRAKRKAGADSNRAKIERFEQLLSKAPDVEPEDDDRL